MFASFTTFSNPFRLPQFLRSSTTNASSFIDLPLVKVHAVETDHSKRARTLKHLLKLNHTNHAIIYHNLQYHNHAPHILGSAYILGGTATHLQHIYETEAKELEGWPESPGEISLEDWRDYLGNAQYQRAYVDFFEDQLVLNDYDWKKLVTDYLFDGPQPLGNNLVSGLGHPLIHLGYAFEFDSREVAMEALGITACSYNYLHKYLDRPAFSEAPSLPLSAKCANAGQQSDNSLIKILDHVRQDTRFDNIRSSNDRMHDLFEQHEAAILQYWKAWDVQDAKRQFRESQYMATCLLVGTSDEIGDKQAYDFFFVHLLTTSHAIRILLPYVPARFHLSLVKQWWLLTLAVFIIQGRPKINLSKILDTDIESESWEGVDKQAVENKWSDDAHYVKGLRAIHVAADTWGDEDCFYLKAAVRMRDHFDGWGGFASMNPDRSREGSAGANGV